MVELRGHAARRRAGHDSRHRHLVRHNAADATGLLDHAGRVEGAELYVYQAGAAWGDVVGRGRGRRLCLLLFRFYSRFLSRRVSTDTHGKG